MYATLPDQTLTRALCCDCGQVRTVKRNHTLRRYVPDFGFGYLLSFDGRRNAPFAQPGDRFMGDLKCSYCGAITRHAVLRDGDPHAHAAEERQHRR